MNFFSKIFGEKEAETKSVYSSMVNFFASLGSGGEFNQEKQLKAYSQNEWVYGAIDSRAKAISQVKLNLRIKTKNGDSEIYKKDHPAMNLLKKPNKGMTQIQLFKILSIHLDTVGKAYWYIEEKDKEKRLIPLIPSNISTIVDDFGIVEGYKYKIGDAGETKTLLPDEIIFFRKTNPEKLSDGLSPLNSCARTFDSDVSASKWNLNFFKNNARPGATLTVPGKLLDKERERIEGQWGSKYGGLDNAHRLAILQNGATMSSDSSSHKDMEFSMLGESAKERILGAYRVPSALLGQSKDFNKANIYGIEYIFSKYSVSPDLREIEEILNYFYLPLFEDDDKLFFEFESSIPQDKETDLREQEVDFMTGAIAPNEIRKKKGREPKENADDIYIPGGLTVVGEVIDYGIGPSTPPEEEDDEKDAKKTVQKKISEKILMQAYLRRFESHEKKVGKTVYKLFVDQEKKVLENLSEVKKDFASDIFEESYWNEAFIIATFPIYEGIFAVEGQSAIDEMGLSTLFRMDDPQVRKLLEKQTVKFASDVNKTTIERIRKVLQDGVAEGEGEVELGKRVKEVFKVAKTSRTKTIARTETLRASSTAHQQSYKQNNIKKKRWISAEDKRVRPSHAEAHNQVRGIDQYFLVGSSRLLHPGDLSAPAKETINCRCREIGEI